MVSVLKNKKHLDEVQYARVFAMFAVLAVHGTSSGLTSTPHDSFVFHIYNFFNVLGKLGVPTFIFLSGFIFFYTYYNKAMTKDVLKRFYTNRLMYILIPYLVFSVLYWVVKNQIYGHGDIAFELKRFMNLLMTGKAHTHLYFVFITVQFYLMFPLFLYFFKKMKWLRKYAIIWGIVLQWLWIYINAKYLQVPMKGSISFSYILSYFAGAFVGIYYEEIINWAKNLKKSGWLLGTLLIGYGFILSFYVMILYMTATGVKSFTNSVHEIAWGSHALFAGFVILIMGYYAKIACSERTKLIMQELASVSFGVYLIHPFFLMGLRPIIQNGDPLTYHGWQLATILITFFGSWMVVHFAYKFIPCAWVFFGKDSAKKQVNK